MSQDTEELAQRLWKALAPVGEAIIDTSLNLGRVEVSDRCEFAANAYIGTLAVKGSEAVGWIVIDGNVACAIAGLLLERPRASILESAPLAKLVGDDADAVAEFANQFISPLNEVIASSLDEPVHFVLKGSASDGTIEPDLESTITLSSPLDPGELAPGTMRLLLPRAALKIPAAAEGADASSSEAREAAGKDGDEPEGSAEGSGATPETGESPGDPRPAGAASGDEDASGGLSLTPEELAAIREATTQMGTGTRTLFVVPVARERDPWRERLGGSELDYAFATSLVAIPSTLRSGEFGVVVIDADACPSGGLYALAKVRTANVPSLVVVVLVSSPTKTHLVGCLAAGAHIYLCKPIETEKLIESIELAAAAA